MGAGSECQSSIIGGFLRAGSDCQSSIIGGFLRARSECQSSIIGGFLRARSECQSSIIGGLFRAWSDCRCAMWVVINHFDKFRRLSVLGQECQSSSWVGHMEIDVKPDLIVCGKCQLCQN